MTPEQIVEKIKKAGLELPASLLIDSHVPVFNLLHNIFFCMSPFISPFISMSSAQSFFEVIKDDTQRERILELLSKNEAT